MGAITASGQDTTPPVLTGFTLSAAIANTTSSPATITVTEQITDDLSGVKFGFADFNSPSGNQEAYCFGALITGTGLNGAWQCQITLPAYSEAGVWTIEVSVEDNAGNAMAYYSSALETLGFPGTLNVTSNLDTTPPVLTGFTFSPAAVNTASNPATLTVTAQVTDDLSGVKSAFADFSSPSGNQVAYCNGSLISGSGLNGVWQCQITLPAYSEAGAWTAQVSVEDNAGNSTAYETSGLKALGFPGTLTVTSNPDTTPPVLTGFTFTPAAADTTSGPVMVTVTEQITDDLSGVKFGFADFSSPSGNQDAYCYGSWISGTALSGIWQCQIAFPAYSEAGPWTAQISVEDNVGNARSYYTSDLEALGFPAVLDVDSTRGKQTITFGVLSNQVFGAAPFTVTATASSGLAVSFASVTPAICTVSSAMVTLVGVGACTIQATQAGNADYLPAPPVNQSLQVTQASQTLAFGPLSNQVIGDMFTVSATASSGLPVSFASTTPATCTILGTTVMLIAVGTCTIQATQAGSAGYAAAPPVSQSFQVTPVGQVIVFGALSSQVLSDAPFTLNATASSGLAVSFASVTTAVCTVSGATVTLVSLGACIIQATQAGNADFAAAPPVTQSFQVTGYTISGQVTLAGKGLSGVTMTLSGSESGAITTNGSGDYSFTLAAGGSYTVTPTLNGCNFSPTSQTFSNLTADQVAAFICAARASGDVALQFVPVTPCRIADTRNPNGPFGGPAIPGGTARSFVIPHSACGIPIAAAAYSINVTVVPHGPLRYLVVWPAGQPLPLASTLNSFDGRVKANAVVIAAGTGGAISAYVTDTTDIVLDINGYFVATPGSSTLTFFPLPPCRIADTRYSNGSLGGPFMTGGRGRPFPILASACNVPATAQAYSLNFTVVPYGRLGYITTWPTGEGQPLASTLNALTGQVTANAAIVPAGAGGQIDVFATNDADLIIDINGYFAPPAAGGLSFYSLTPCRVLDTRNPPGTPPFSGTLRVNVAGSQCAPPDNAQAYIFNATVVPAGAFGYLTLWPQGPPRPVVSTLNALDGAVTSNMAIVPATDGWIDSFADDPTYLVLDLSGYFAP